MEESSKMRVFQRSARRSGVKCTARLCSTRPNYSDRLSLSIYIYIEVNAKASTKNRWRAAIHTLAKLHRVSPSSIDVSTFGKPSGFYDRQLKTLSTVSESQSRAVDIETHEPVGQIPHFDEMVAFFRDPKTRPRDRNNIVHGDFKIDNLVYHKTKTRVIGILEYVRSLRKIGVSWGGKLGLITKSWEMSTLGHPLSDLSNLMGPYTLAAAASAAFTAPSAPSPLQSRINPAFIPPITMPGLPSRTQLIQWYAEVAGWDPSAASGWGDAFGVFRNSVIMQGIAARWALRQASSARAIEYAVQMRPFGELAWGLCKGLQESGHERVGSKL